MFSWAKRTKFTARFTKSFHMTPYWEQMTHLWFTYNSTRQTWISWGSWITSLSCTSRKSIISWGSRRTWWPFPTRSAIIIPRITWRNLIMESAFNCKLTKIIFNEKRYDTYKYTPFCPLAPFTPGNPLSPFSPGDSRSWGQHLSVKYKLTQNMKTTYSYHCSNHSKTVYGIYCK